jgi:methionyl-tRNA synthetase
MSKYYITTPIYYINDVPHIGHAYTTIAADVLARYYRKKGDEVFFLTGTDEHGAKIAEAAEQAGKAPADFVNDLRPAFKKAWEKLNISYDEFFYTSNPKHEKLVQEFVQTLKDKGFIEKRKYEGLYCVGCEKFLKEADLADGLCPDHKKAPAKQAEENYFFKLSDPVISNKLVSLISLNELEIGPESRKNEVLGKIKQGLEDVSISRAAVEWGVPFPGDEKQTIYVWIDALLNYYTATKIYGKEEFWPANLHLMAKDILWFHAVIWPAMLMAADLPLPKKVFAHGFFTINNQKMSKTLGNVIDPVEVTDKFGADAVRYALLREFPFGEDGDISEEKIANSYNKLANNIGNLVQRTLSMINKYSIAIPASSVIPAKAGIQEVALQNSNQTPGSPGTTLKNTAGPEDDNLNVDTDLDNLDFMGALRKIDEFAEKQNQFIASTQPWALAKEGKGEELTQVLTSVYQSLYVIAELIEPFMPETAQKMKKQLETLQPEPLFPRLEINKTDDR